jgi:hypothetical protein
MSWSRSLSEFADEQEKRLNAQLRATALQALSGVIERSPVDTGRFRGNNQVSVGRDETGTVDRSDKSGREALAVGATEISSVKAPFTYIVVQNNLPYADVLEMGSSKQAPMGIFAATFESLKR